ncbi:MAG: GNAT family N-acetyltransferase [Eubacteriales bacterium]|nr:GNAT family N-acetyltransferase [Eubacteriales bacterium]
MLLIRELTEKDDFHDVGGVYVESWCSAYRGIVPQGYLDKLSPERWSGPLSAEPASSLGMYMDDRLIGTSHVCFARDAAREGYGEIVSLYLRPAYVGRGYGRLLMQAALAKLKNDGCTDVCLWALIQNLRAEGFYEHMGFKASGRTMLEPIGGEELLLREYIISLGAKHAPI